MVGREAEKVRASVGVDARVGGAEGLGEALGPTTRQQDCREERSSAGQVVGWAVGVGRASGG